jgi:hypothetical protein
MVGIVTGFRPANRGLKARGRRVAAQQAEGRAKRPALRAAVVRLLGEASDTPLD